MNSDAQELSSPVTESSLSSDEIKAVKSLIDGAIESEYGDEWAEFLDSLSWTIENYEDGFGEMPGKTEDLTNLCRFALRVFFNNVIYRFFNGDDCEGGLDQLITVLIKNPNIIQIAQKLFSASDFELIDFATQSRNRPS